MADLVSGENQRSEGVTAETHAKEARVWNQSYAYCNAIENDHDPFMQELDPTMRSRIFGAFAAALQWREFSKPGEKNLGVGYVQETLAMLGQAFRAKVGYNRYLGEEGSAMNPILARQFNGMQNNDPSMEQQKALPVFVYQKALKHAKPLQALY